MNWINGFELCVCEIGASIPKFDIGDKLIVPLAWRQRGVSGHPSAVLHMFFKIAITNLIYKSSRHADLRYHIDLPNYPKIMMHNKYIEWN